MSLEDPPERDRPDMTAPTPAKTMSSASEGLFWKVPSPCGAPAAVETLSTIAAPLLAGFSITLAGVIIQASERFRFPGIALLLLVIAGVLLLSCVQCGFWARHYYMRPGDAIEWWPDYESNLHRRKMLVNEQRQSYARYKRWSKLARHTYSFGIVVFLLGIMVTLIPTGAGWQSKVQWGAVSVAALAAAGELIWLMSASRQMLR